MNQSSTKQTDNMKTANKPTRACICTRARAHARTPLRTLACAWALFLALMVGAGSAWGQTLEKGTTPISTTGESTHTTPTGWKITKIECWGGGGSGAYRNSGSSSNKTGGGGGGGGGYVGANVYFPQGAQVTVKVGTGGAAVSNGSGNLGGASYVDYNSNTFRVTANGGAGASDATGGYGAGQNNTAVGSWTNSSTYLNGTPTTHKGGNGATSSGARTRYSGGGGAGAGSGADGGSASNSDGGAGVSTNPGASISYQYYQSTGWFSGEWKNATLYGGSGGTGNAYYDDYSTSNSLIGSHPELNEGRNGRNYGGGGAGAHDYNSGKGGNGFVRITTEACDVRVVFNENKPSATQGNVSWNSNNTLASLTNHTYEYAKYDSNVYKSPFTNALQLKGYTFNGFFTASSGGTQVNYDSKITTTLFTALANSNAWTGTPANVGNITLYAQWTAKTYDLTLHANGTTVSPAKFGTGENNGSITAKATYDKGYNTATYTGSSWNAHFGVTRVGYTFKGWYATKAAADLAGDDTIHGVTAYTTDGNKELWAGWVPCPVIVTFDGQNPEPDSTITWNMGNDLSLDHKYAGTYDKKVYPSDWSGKLSLTGYSFDGFFKDAACSDDNVVSNGIIINTSNFTISNLANCSGSMTLYAKWTPKPYTLILDAGTDINSWGDCYNCDNPYDRIRSFYREKFTDPAFGGGSCVDDSLVRADWIFKGWYTEPTGGRRINRNTALTVNDIDWSNATATLYAQWQLSPTCLLHLNGGTLTTTCISGCNLEQNESGLYRFKLTNGQVFDSCSGLNATGAAADAYITREGYTFDGWYDQDGTTSGQWGTQFSFKDTVFHDSDGGTHAYAKWSPKQYTLTFNANNGTFGSGATKETKIYYDSAYKTAKPALAGDATNWSNHFGVQRTGFEFVGWYDYEVADNANAGDSITNSSLFKQDNDNTVLYAGWKPVDVTVKYNPHGGSQPQDSKATYTQAYPHSCNRATQRAGYLFKGWWLTYNETSGEYTNQVIFGQTLCNNYEEHTLHAKWDPDTAVVKYNTHGGSSVADSKAAYTEPYPESCNGVTTQDGYTFKGWWLTYDETSGEYADSVTFGTNGTICNVYPPTVSWLHAKWKANNYIITFHANGNDGSPAYFDNRNTANGTKDANITFANKYESAMATSGVTTWAGHYGVFRPGYHFDYWYNSNNVTIAGTENYTTVGKTDLNAHWTANNYYTLKLNANGYGSYNGKFGSATEKTLTGLIYDTRYEDLTDNTGWMTFGATLTGHTLTGWNTEPNGSGNARTANDLFTGDDTLSNSFVLYAQWQPRNVVVTFNANGTANSPAYVPQGQTSTETTKTYSYGSNMNNRPTPSRAGYTFDGWYLGDTEITDETKCDQSAIVFADATSSGTLTVVAKWTAKKYNLVLNANDNNKYPAGFDNNTTTKTKTISNINYDTHYGDINGWKDFGVSRLGFIFANWKTAASGGETRSEADPFNGNDTLGLYADWTPRTVKVTFIPNGAYMSNTERDYTYGQAFGYLPVISKTGYENADWYLGETQIFNTTLCDTNLIQWPDGEDYGTLTLEAHWTPKQYPCCRAVLR